MNWTEILLIVLVAVVIVAGAAHALTREAAKHGWHGAGAAAFAEIGGGHREWRQGRHRAFSHRCDGRWVENVDEAIERVEKALELRPEQAAAWAKLAARVRSGGTALVESCEGLKTAKGSERAPEALARAESMMVAGLQAVREFRAPFEAFYSVLTEAQRKTFDQLFAGHHWR